MIKGPRLIQRNSTVKNNVLLVFFSLVFLFFLFNNILPNYLEIGFNQYIWKTFPKYRYAMSQSLITKINKEQLNITEVKNLLGQPNSRINSYHVEYFLRNNSILGFDSDYLSISFTDSTEASIYNTD